MFDNQWPMLLRRDWMNSAVGGLAGMALSWLTQREAAAGTFAATHTVPRAQRVIQIFCCGGVSHLDTFDYKPALERMHGSTLQGKGENLGFFGQPGKLMKSVYPFKQYGESGSWVSSVFPELAQCVDDLCFVHSMVAKSNNHTPATFQMNSGFTLNGFPSLGAWLSYGLGTENENLPAYVVLPDARGLAAGGSINWAAGFLPANHQGVAFRTRSREAIVDLATPAHIAAEDRATDLELLATMNREFIAEHPGEETFVARMRAYQLAARMQLSVPQATDLTDETAHTLASYGVDDESNHGFGRNCLLARRLVERGVRFVQLFNGGAFGSPRINWDGHENLKENHDAQARTMDRPVAALIRDLKQRGLLDDTLLIWNTEFGRGPATQGIDAPGRDHHPSAFTSFMAGAGVKPGLHYGNSDEIGYFAAEHPVSIPDFHATVLHLLGIDHTRLTFYHNGINRRLTDVHGEVIHGLLK